MFLLLLAAVFLVFVMEVTYWCFLWPEVIGPLARMIALRKRRDH
jgi:hypothetical protein